MIFDTFERTDPSPKLSIESDFDFLNRSSRVEVCRARNLMESLLREYPESADLAARFRSGDNRHFRSAEFELLLFSYLKKCGFRLSPHPMLRNGSTSRPDFLVTSPSGDEFYLEAVLATESTEDRTNESLLATTLDVFSTATHENFCVIVDTSGYPTTQPSRKQLLRRTLTWLNSLDPDEVQAQLDIDGHKALPSFVWTHEKLEIYIQALPLRADRRGKAHRLLGAQFGQVGWIDSWTPIRDSIRAKGSKYGKLGKPFVVAVNFLGHHLDRRDEMQALFGEERIVFSTVNSGPKPRSERAANGSWVAKGGPVFTRVSGAWLFENFCVFDIPNCSPMLYVHPWARHAIPDDMLQFSHAIGEQGLMKWHEGIKPNSVFDPIEGWPDES